MNLVTGGTGLVGSHLIMELLLSGRKVKALRRPYSDVLMMKKVFQVYMDNPDDWFSQIEWVEGDILDVDSIENAMDGVEDVYHAAAIISFHRSDRHRMQKVNVEGTANVVNAALDRNIKKLCHVSSVAALGRPEDELGIIDERLVWKPSRNNTGYAISKYGAEREVWRGMAEGLNAVIVNPSIILGVAGPKKGSTRLFSTVLNGLKFYPSGINGFVDVTDVTKAMIQLMDSEITNERFILNAENIEYRKLFAIIARYLQKPEPYWKAGKFLAELGWYFESLRGSLMKDKPLITKETARTANQKYYYSNEKIRDAINFSFIPIEESIKRYCEIILQESANQRVKK